MKKLLLILLTTISLPIVAQNYVPTNLKESLIALDEHLTNDERKQYLRYAESEIVHAYNFSVGAYIRSHWGLNDETSRLNNYFRLRGIKNSHEMSNIILVSYYRVHHDKFINLEAQIEDYIGEKELKKVKRKLRKAGEEL